MKKIITKTKQLLVAFTTLSCLCAEAQPILQSPNVNTLLSLNIYSVSGVNTSTTMALSGANVTWDLSSAIIGTPVGTIDYMPASATGYGAQYPSANYAMKLTTGAATKYDFSVVTSTVMEDTAINVGTGGLQTFVNNRTSLVFPFTYGLSMVDTYQKSGQSATTISHNYDAYGTVIIGTDTLHNLVRDMNTDNGVSTTQALWYNVSPLYPVLAITSSGVTYLKSNTTVGISEISKNDQISIFPNPAQNTITVFNSPSINKIEIYDALGQFQTTSTQSIIDISNLSSGVYFLKAETDKGILIKKFIKQ